MNFHATFQDKIVLVTGHTGFKGSWLCEWLMMLNARVVGYALEPPTTPSLFERAGLSDRLEADVRGDVLDLAHLNKTIEKYQPDFIFHLAAQSLVQESYINPLYTTQTNCIGSVNVLEALRISQHPCTVIMVTTDKVYENSGGNRVFSEDDPLGGYDVYSASKACAEIMISSYRRSFFNISDEKIPTATIASVRGGNIIGGGDWADNRLVPDCMRALANGETIPIRNPNAVRPWQHVLDLIHGYLTLATAISEAKSNQNTEALQRLCSAFNFGPYAESHRPAHQLVDEILKHWEGKWESQQRITDGHEASHLALAIDKAKQVLAWQPNWSFEETITYTTQWYRCYYQNHTNSESIQALTQRQIKTYSDITN